MKKYYTYELIDSRTNQVFYVGKGSNKRMYYHYNRVIVNKHNIVNSKLQNKLLSIFKNDGYIIYNKINTINEQEALDLEVKLIKKYRKDNINLCNLTDGGEGISGYTFKHSEETKKKISKRLKNKPKTEDHKQQLIKAKKNNPNNTTYWKNKKFTNEHKNKLSVGAKNRPPITEETRLKLRENNKSYLLKGKTLTEIYGAERAKLMNMKNSKAHKDKKLTKETKNKISKAVTGINHPRAKIYIINNNGNIIEEKMTMKMLSEKLELKFCTIRNIINNNKTINNISIKIKSEI